MIEIVQVSYHGSPILMGFCQGEPKIYTTATFVTAHLKQISNPGMEGLILLTQTAMDYCVSRSLERVKLLSYRNDPCSTACV